jgi:hypothetical protein
VNYHLSFLDGGQNVQEVWEADFAAEHTAISWMWIAGGLWAQHSEWSTMELRCRRCEAGRLACPRALSADRGCCIARVPASALKQGSCSQERLRASPVILIVEPDAFSSRFHEDMVTAAGCSAVTFADCASAGTWLMSNSPDAAIIDVKPTDKGCGELARRLSLREIPILVVSNCAAASRGVDPIFQPIPWFEKPLTSAGFQLALRSML